MAEGIRQIIDEIKEWINPKTSTERKEALINNLINEYLQRMPTDKAYKINLINSIDKNISNENESK